MTVPKSVAEILMMQVLVDSLSDVVIQALPICPFLHPTPVPTDVYGPDLLIFQKQVLLTTSHVGVILLRSLRREDGW